MFWRLFSSYIIWCFVANFINNIHIHGPYLLKRARFVLQWLIPSLFFLIAGQYWVLFVEVSALHTFLLDCELNISTTGAVNDYNFHTLVWTGWLSLYWDPLGFNWRFQTLQLKVFNWHINSFDAWFLQVLYVKRIWSWTSLWLKAQNILRILSFFSFNWQRTFYCESLFCCRIPQFLSSFIFVRYYLQKVPNKLAFLIGYFVRSLELLLCLSATIYGCFTEQIVIDIISYLLLIKSSQALVFVTIWLLSN